MRTAGWLKVAGAFLLAACFALPMTSCTEYRDDAGRSVSVLPGKAPAPGLSRTITRFYLLDNLHAEDPMSWPYVGVFLCPGIVLIYARKYPATRLRTVLWFMEPLLLAGVVYSVWYMNFFDDPDIGSYVADGGAAVYFFGWIGEARERFRARRQSRLAL